MIDKQMEEAFQRNLDELARTKDLPTILLVKILVQEQLEKTEKRIRERDGHVASLVNESVDLVNALVMVERCKKAVQRSMESCG